MALGAMRRRVVHVEDVFSGWPCTLRLFGYNIVNAICIMILCGAPGAAIVYCVFNHGNLGLSVAIIAISTLVIVATLVFSTFVMMGQLLVVEGTSVFEAYKQVFTTMRPHYGAILGAVTVMVLLCLASMCTFFLAGFVLAPMWLILQALVGRDTLGISAGPESLPPNWLSPGSEGPPGAWPPPPKV